MTAAEEAFRESLTIADRSGHACERLATRWNLAMALVAGPVPVGRCLEECEELTKTLGVEHPGLLTERAVLWAMQGRFEDARALNERARRIFVEEIRARRMLMFLAKSQATVELLSGDLAAAVREFRTVLEFAREFGERDHISQTAARLALVLRVQGGSDEVSSLALASAQTAPADGIAAQVLSRAALAASATGAADHREADRLARQAVGLAPVEMPNLRADVLVEFAQVLRADDQEKDAVAAVKEAARLYERKGSTVSAERVTRALRRGVMEKPWAPGDSNPEPAD
jgi:tetratricopeptide (TPR) repeat protein